MIKKSAMDRHAIAIIVEHHVSDLMCHVRPSSLMFWMRQHPAWAVGNYKSIPKLSKSKSQSNLV